jgi:hypothetical protein
MIMESHGGMIWTGENRRTRRKTCPSATLSTTNHTWSEPGANPDLRGKRPVTNRLSYGTATLTSYLLLFFFADQGNTVGRRCAGCGVGMEPSATAATSSF